MRVARGEHAVLGGDPAAAGVAQPAGDALLDGGVAEDAGVAGLDEHGAFGHDDEAGGEAGGAEGRRRRAGRDETAGVESEVVGAGEGCCRDCSHRGDYSCGEPAADFPKWDSCAISRQDESAHRMRSARGFRFGNSTGVSLDSWDSAYGLLMSDLFGMSQFGTERE